MTDNNKVRIIGGKWRGTKLGFADIEGLRPSGDRVRETLFNWLAPYIHNSNCLDLYAGSGCLGFEALSRGAKRVVALDNHTEVVAMLNQEMQRIKADDLKVVKTDAIDWLEHAAKQRDSRQPSTDEAPFDIVFADPPFAANLLNQTVRTLDAAMLSGVLASDALIYIETAKTAPALKVPDSWRSIRQKQAGAVSFALYELRVE